jgi:hypothetical protein
LDGEDHYELTDDGTSFTITMEEDDDALVVDGGATYYYTV